MGCRAITQRLDAWMDGELRASEQTALEQHLDRCPSCRARAEVAQQTAAYLRSMPVPPPRPGFADRILGEVTGEDRARERRGWALALAATLVLGIAVGMLVNPARHWLGGESPVVLTTGQTQPVRLVFESPDRLQGVMFTIELPENVELRGHPGRRQITWRTDIEAGKNLLVLPITARAPGAGHIVARIARGERAKYFDVEFEARSTEGPAATPAGA